MKGENQGRDRFSPFGNKKDQGHWLSGILDQSGLLVEDLLHVINL
jgi:hypothetical protein